MSAKHCRKYVVRQRPRLRQPDRTKFLVLTSGLNLFWEIGALKNLDSILLRCGATLHRWLVAVPYPDLGTSEFFKN